MNALAPGFGGIYLREKLEQSLWLNIVELRISQLEKF